MSNAQKRGLGRGFDALIPTQIVEEEFDPTAKLVGNETAAGEQVQQIPADQIEPNPNQPRQHFDETALRELAASIKAHGIVQPLVMTEVAPSRYQLIAGERRLRAAKLVGLAEVPAIVRSTTQQQQLEVALIENLQRADLNLIETATAYRKLLDQFNMKQEDIGRQVGKASSTVANIVRMLNLPIEAKRAVAAGLIVEGHARAILAVVEPAKQQEMLDLILKHHWSVQQAEDYSRSLKSDDPGRRAKALERVQGSNDLTRDLGDYLGAKVMMQPRAKGGRLVIEYYSDEELQRIYETIKKPGP
jgi:ParB family transcriptional regulator, chromosome partitioning protein